MRFYVQQNDSELAKISGRVGRQRISNMRCGSQEWLLWEMDQLLKQGRLVDTTIIVTPDNKAET
jgi:hypothetical protein